MNFRQCYSCVLVLAVVVVGGNGDKVRFLVQRGDVVRGLQHVPGGPHRRRQHRLGAKGLAQLTHQLVKVALVHCRVAAPLAGVLPLDVEAVELVPLQELGNALRKKVVEVVRIFAN